AQFEISPTYFDVVNGKYWYWYKSNKCNIVYDKYINCKLKRIKLTDAIIEKYGEITEAFMIY
ncbi:MAG: hypothetical protein Faunusvirus27_10, partial [Faunusvirus sp.]